MRNAFGAFTLLFGQQAGSPASL